MSIWDILKFGGKKIQPPPPVEEIVEPQDLRETDRETLYRDSRVFYHSGDSDPCIINDVSETGLRISCQRAKSFPDTLRIQWSGQKRLCKVVWVEGILAGLEFVDLKASDKNGPAVFQSENYPSDKNT